ncbi:MAG: epoxyqueuosine reductase QueH [Treponemataceae bacterium]
MQTAKKFQSQNFNTQCNEIIKNIKTSNRKPSLLLHVCCAPCSSAVLLKLQNFNITVYFYNPNIAPFEEYQKRTRI